MIKEKEINKEKESASSSSSNQLSLQVSGNTLSKESYNVDKLTPNDSLTDHPPESEQEILQRKISLFQKYGMTAADVDFFCQRFDEKMIADTLQRIEMIYKKKQIRNLPGYICTVFKNLNPQKTEFEVLEEEKQKTTQYEAEKRKTILSQKNKKKQKIALIMKK